jgi:hypothetical protein
MPDSRRQREIFRLFVEPNENLVVPVRRKEACVNPRVKELLAAGFEPADVGVDNVPNARYLWKSAFDVMRKQGYLTHTPYPHVMKNGKKKNISKYTSCPLTCASTGS